MQLTTLAAMTPTDSTPPIQALLAALFNARSEFQPIYKDKHNTYHNTKYAALDTVLAAIEPALQKHGLMIVQTTEVAGEQSVLKTSLYHCESGQSISGNYPLPPTDNPQKMGAAITYGRRYALCALLSVTADEDDDGNTASISKSGSTASPPRSANTASPPKSGNTASKPAAVARNSGGTITKEEWEARKRSSAQ